MAVQRSFQQPQATLYLVATPIGNLQDITLRAVAVLKRVHYILCEDTRRTKILLNHWQIHKPLISYHKFNAELRHQRILMLLRAGKHLALVSDAGTPLISDPGYLIVRASIEHQFNVIAVGINCAAIHGLICAGVRCDSFYVRGFLPHGEQQRTKQLRQLSNCTVPIVLYESRYRILALLSDIKLVYPQAALFVGRELTKINEWMAWGSAAEIATNLRASSQKGEYVVVIQQLNHQQQLTTQIKAACQLLIERGIKRSEAKAIVKKINFLN